MSRNRAILPGFGFRVPSKFFTVPVPTAPVPSLKFYNIFKLKTRAVDLVFGFFSGQLHAWVRQCPIRVLFTRYSFLVLLRTYLSTVNMKRFL